MDLTKNRFYVGTARGLLLRTSDKPKNIKVFKNDETSEITCMSHGRSTEEIILGYESNIAYIFNTETETFTRKIEELTGHGGLTGVFCSGDTIVLGTKDGIVNIVTKKLRKKDENFFSLELEETGSLEAMACNQNRENIIGTGGEHNDYKLWDIQTSQCIFKAKSIIDLQCKNHGVEKELKYGLYSICSTPVSVPYLLLMGHDSLQLPIPTSIRGITFFSDAPHCGACCTKEGHVLLYDDRAQRRPVIKFNEPKASYTTISSASVDRQVLVGTTKGYMQWLDLRDAAKLLKTYTSYTGCVTDIVCDASEPYVASVSLDRHLRVHNMESKQLIHKIYMKQNLTKLLIKPVIKIEDDKEGDVRVDQEFEDIFDNMETIEESESITKRKKVKLGLEKKKKKLKLDD